METTSEVVRESLLETNEIENNSNFLKSSNAVKIKDVSFDNKEAEVLLQVTVYKENGDNKEKTKKTEESFLRRYAGILLTLVCAIFFAFGALLVKLLRGYHPFTLGVFRFQGLLLPYIPMMIYAKFVKKKSILKPLWPLNKDENGKTFALVVFRGIFGCGALIFHFYGLQYLSIADKMTIGSCKPVLVTIVAHLTLKEKCSFFSFSVAILTMLGIGIILRPPILTGADTFDLNLLIGTAFSIGAVLTSTFSVTATRYLRQIHFSVMNFIFGICGTIVCLILAFSFQVFTLPKNPRDWMLAIALAAVTLLVQSLFTLALKYEKAGPVSVVRTTETVFAFLWQFLFLGIEPDIFSMLGAGIIITGTLLITWSKWLNTLPIDDPTRRKYSCILIKHSS